VIKLRKLLLRHSFFEGYYYHSHAADLLKSHRIIPRRIGSDKESRNSMMVIILKQFPILILSNYNIREAVLLTALNFILESVIFSGENICLQQRSTKR